MPADKLILLSFKVDPRFQELAERKGERRGGYSRVIDLSKTSAKLPARLSCRGIHDGVNKLEFIGVSHLGLSGVRKIAKKIFGDLRHVRIARIDVCIDIDGISVLDFALYCRLARAQNCSVERSRSGITFYLRRSKQHVLLIYDRLARLRSKRDPLAECYSSEDQCTRVEVQLRGRGLQYRKFEDIERYAEIDLLSGLSFWKLGFKKDSLKPIDALAAEGLLHKIDNFGLQATSKMYKSSTWAYLQRKFLAPSTRSMFSELNNQMKKSMRAWIEGPIRFPRLKKKSFQPDSTDTASTVERDAVEEAVWRHLRHHHKRRLKAIS